MDRRKKCEGRMGGWGMGWIQDSVPHLDPAVHRVSSVFPDIYRCYRLRAPKKAWKVLHIRASLS